MKNIVLIGMPGAGKSTAGVLLAKAMGYHFLDSDLLIQEQEGRLLPEIIEEEGLDRFIEIENQVNADIRTDKTVIATGGSVVYGKEAMEYFHDTAIVVYLKVSFSELKKRVGNPKQRGVVLREEQTFLDLYEERSPLYERYAHISVEAEGREIGELLEELRAAIDPRIEKGISQK